MTPLRKLAYEGLQHLQTRHSYPGRRPLILVHQMARVGSMTVLRALRTRFPERNGVHTHYLNPDTIEEFRARFDRVFEVTGRPGRYREYRNARLVQRWLRHDRAGDWHIISLVRDPVARTISAFFRHLPLNRPELGTAFREDPVNVPRLAELFLDGSEPEADFALEWFDREVRDVFGVDVFASPYPRTGEGARFSCSAGRILVLRLEDLDAHGPTELGAFLETDPVSLPPQNQGETLGYANAYRRFLDQVRLPGAYLDRMYGSKLARHFYTPEELDAFRMRWATR